MLKLYTWTTPNGRKIPILLEELGIPYEIEFVDIGRDQQFEPAFLSVSPNNKIPAIVDDGTVSPNALPGKVQRIRRRHGPQTQAR